MKDYRTFDRLVRCKSPKEAKALGRQVAPWDQREWDRIVCTVARACVLAKSRAVPAVRRALLATGDAMLAEATRNDSIWGIGIDLGKPEVQFPGRWQGANILGWALMEARDSLNAERGFQARTSNTDLEAEPVKRQRSH